MENPAPELQLQRKEMAVKDGPVLDVDSFGPVYRGGDCCFISCVYTSDHYHCQVCGISTPEANQALAHIRASPACRRDSSIHYPASSVAVPTDTANSLYNAIYSGFTAQNTYPTPGFSGYTQIDSFQWHSSMSEKVAICSSQLSPCCSSNGGTYIPVENQLCSPIGDLYSKVAGPMRDLVSLPAKSSGSGIDSQAWFSAFNPQQMPKMALKYSDQSTPTQNNFLTLDSLDQRHQDLNSSSGGDLNASTSSSYCGKTDPASKDALKEQYCVYASQSMPGMLSEDTFFSLQLPEETLKHADMQQSPLPQIILNDVNVNSKQGSQIDGSGNCTRIENHFTQEHFGHYMANCNPYPPEEEQESTSVRSTEISNQPSSAASDSDESDIIVEDTGDELGSHMTESEIFIEDIKCSLLQGVISEEDEQPSRDVTALPDKAHLNLTHKKNDKVSSRVQIQSESHLRRCVSSFTILKCVVCEKTVSDDNPGSVFVQMSTQMPLTTSSQTPVLSKLNEVVAIEVTDFLDVNGKFMCQSCFNLVDTVDSLEKKLESLKQNITAMVKTGSKSPASGANQSIKLTDSVEQHSPRLKSSTASCLEDMQALYQRSFLESSNMIRPVSALEQSSCQDLANNVKQKEYLLLSDKALYLMNSRSKAGDHHSSVLEHDGSYKNQSVLDVELSVLPKLPNVQSGSCIPPQTQILSEEASPAASQNLPFLANQKGESLRTGGITAISPEINKPKLEGRNSKYKKEVVKCLKGGSEQPQGIYQIELDKENAGNVNGRFLNGKGVIASLMQTEKPFTNRETEGLQSHSSECTGGNCKEILIRERQKERNLKNETCAMFTCDLCKEVFASNQFLEDHKLLFPTMDSLLCETCGKQYHTQVQLDDHMFDAHLIYEKHCEFCEAKFFHPCTYEVHLQTHSEEKSYSCSQCAVKFTVQSAAIAHKAKCKSSVRCSKCSQTFPLRSLLVEHTRTIHEEKRISYKCDKCSKTFIKPSDLQAHQRSHSDEKKFHCKICGRRYKSLGNLNHHAKSHKKNKPYTCEVCSQGFIRKEHLEAHFNSHKDNKPFKCDQCEKSFWSQSYLQSHIKWHLDKNKKVTCPICQKTFTQRLNVHMRSHTGEKPHPCEKCPRKFITGSSLRKHVRRVHGQKSPTVQQYSGSDTELDS